MGIIAVILENERGEPIEKLEGKVHLLGKYLPVTDKSFQCLRFIDHYGDTVFNGPQMEQFSTELQNVMRNAETKEEKDLFKRVLDMAKKCEDHPHHYLKFYGD
jgi:hypothetical protein